MSDTPQSLIFAWVTPGQEEAGPYRGWLQQEGDEAFGCPHEHPTYEEAFKCPRRIVAGFPEFRMLS